MKAKSKVQVRTLAGLVDAPCFHQWKQDVGGMEFEFALHIAAGHAKGFVAPLAISELGKGFDVKAILLHPITRKPLSSSTIQGLKSDQVKKVARAALHNLLHKKVGAGRFLQAMLGAQMQLSKIDLGKYEDKGGLAAPGTATFSTTATPEQIAVLDAMFGVCEVCNGTQVVATTDIDHEGNTVEDHCPACTPRAIQVTETTVGDMMAEQLRERRSHLQERADQHGTMTGDTGEGEYGEICEEIDDLTQKINELEGTPCSN